MSRTIIGAVHCLYSETIDTDPLQIDDSNALSMSITLCLFHDFNVSFLRARGNASLEKRRIVMFFGCRGCQKRYRRLEV